MSLQGVDPLVAVAGEILDPWTVIVPITVRVGRESPNSQADANTCSFALFGALPPDVRMNAPLEVYLAWGGGGVWDDVWVDIWSDTDVDGDPSERITRFIGRITDLNPIAEASSLKTEVVATGRMGDLGRVKSGWYAFPAETEDARLQRLSLEAAEAGIDLIGLGYTWMMAPRDLETASVLDIVYDTATAGGLVHETVEGAVQFDHWAAREEAQPVLYLLPTDLEDSVGWSQQIDAFIARAVVRYGTPAEGNEEQPQVTIGKRGWGRPETVISTYLRDASDATAFGTLVLNRWGDQGAFEAPVLNVVASLVPAATWDAVMGLAFGDVVVTTGVTPVPAILPQGSTEWFVEGWSEVYDKQANGPIWHRVAVSVSDRSRFRPDLGVPVNVIDFVVTPSSAPFNTARTATALLLTTFGEPVTAGEVRLMNGNKELARLAAPAPDGSVTFTIGGKALPIGSHVLTLAYGGSWPDFLATYADAPATTVVDASQPGDPVVASVSLTVQPLVVNEGQKVTAYATVAMTQGASRAGKVSLQLSRNKGSSWVAVDSEITRPGGSAEYVLTWTTTDGATHARLRARYIPDLQGVAAVTSNTIDPDVRQQETRTLGYNAAWDASYRGDGTLNASVKPLYHGYAEPVNGNMKSLAGFAVPPGEWAGWTITKVEVYLSNGYWMGSSGSVRIGSHQHAQPPPSAPAIYPGRTTVTGWKEDQAQWVNVTTWGKGLATGALKGIVLGPGLNKDPVWRGWEYGAGSDGPILRVTGYRWA